MRSSDETGLQLAVVHYEWMIHIFFILFQFLTWIAAQLYSSARPAILMCVWKLYAGFNNCATCQGPSHCSNTTGVRLRKSVWYLLGPSLGSHVDSDSSYTSKRSYGRLTIGVVCLPAAWLQFNVIHALESPAGALKLCFAARAEMHDQLGLVVCTESWRAVWVVIFVAVDWHLHILFSY